MKSAWARAYAAALLMACMGGGLSLWPGWGAAGGGCWPLLVISAGGVGTALWLGAYLADVGLARHALLNGASYCFGVAVLWGLVGGGRLHWAVVFAYLGIAMAGLTGWGVERAQVRSRVYRMGGEA